MKRDEATQPGRWADSQTGFGQQPLFGLAVAAVLGIALAEWLIPHLPGRGLWWGIGLVVATGLVLVAWARSAAAWVFLASVFFLNASLHDHRGRQLPGYDRLANGGGLPVEATGVVDQLVPSRDTPAGGFSTTIRLESLETRWQHYGSRLRVRVLGSRDQPRPVYGDRVQVSGFLQLPAMARNRGQFDARSHLRSRGTWAEIRAESELSRVEILGSDPKAWLGWAVRAREWIANAVTRDLDDEPQAQALLVAMFLGAKEEASLRMIDDFRYSGALHVFAVSGLHVGLVGAILWAILRFLRLPRRAILVIVAILLVSYTCVTGLRPSAVRATTMALVVLGGLLLDRQPRLLNSLGAAALVLLAWEPFRLLDLGFQLSFGVLLAIALLVPLLRRLLSGWSSPDPFLPTSLLTDGERRHYAGRSWIADVAAVSVAAWAGSTPLNLIHFSLVTPIALVANPLVLVLTSAILFGAILSTFFSLFSLTSGVAMLFNNGNLFLGKMVLGLVGGLSEVPGGHAHIGLPEWPPWGEELRVEVLDLPRGGACQLVEVPGSKGWLIDTGDEHAFRSTTLAFLKTRGLLELDGVFLSHSDMRHSGGIEQLEHSLEPGRVLGPPLAEMRAQLVAPTRTGMRIPLSGPAVGKGTIEVLFPPLGELANKTDDRALVLRVEQAGWRILFKSDAGFETEKWLLAHMRDRLQADVLVTGRHNSDYSLLEEFVLAVGPQVVVATHARFPPEQELPMARRQMLKRMEIPLFDQSRTGAVRIRAFEDQMELRGFLDQELRLDRRRPVP